jgi:hypothetical protein
MDSQQLLSCRSADVLRTFTFAIDKPLKAEVDPAANSPEDGHADVLLLAFAV